MPAPLIARQQSECAGGVRVGLTPCADALMGCTECSLRKPNLRRSPMRWKPMKPCAGRAVEWMPVRASCPIDRGHQTASRRHRETLSRYPRTKSLAVRQRRPNTRP